MHRVTSPIAISLFDGGPSYCIDIVDSYQDGVDPVSDPSLTPPDGLYQPEYGLGKAWRENPEIRERLGWAIDWGVNYTATTQGEYVTRYGGDHHFTTLPDGEFLWEVNGPPECNVSSADWEPVQ